MMPSFLHAVLAPMQAVLRAQRALLNASIDRLRSLWCGTDSQRPVLFELPLPHPAARRMRLHVPAAALSAPTPLSLSRARVDFVWQLDQVTLPPAGNRTHAPQISGRVAPPAGHGRRSHLHAGICVELVLRRQEPAEGLLKLQQAAARLAVLPQPRMRGRTR